MNNQYKFTSFFLFLDTATTLCGSIKSEKNPILFNTRVGIPKNRTKDAPDTTVICYYLRHVVSHTNNLS